MHNICVELGLCAGFQKNSGEQDRFLASRCTYSLTEISYYAFTARRCRVFMAGRTNVVTAAVRLGLSGLGF